MIKNDYGRLNTPYYEDKKDSGLSVVLIPKKTDIKSAILYISQGFYLHDEEINNSKINFGCPFLLKEIILDDNTKSKINKLGCRVETVCEHSYTYYKFTTLSSLVEPINIFLERIRNLTLSDEEVEKYKRKLIENSLETPLSLAEENTISNLFFSSPMKKGSYIKKNDLVKIHLTEMKKFLFRYYSLKMMTLFIAGDYSPSSCDELLSKLQFPAFPNTNNKVIKFEEDYSKVFEKRSVIYKKNSDNILTLGIKFEKRENLFEKYGELIFVFYEIFLDFLTKNSKFEDLLLKTDALYLNGKVIEGYEDTLAILSFKCDEFAKFSNALSDYLSNTVKTIGRKFFDTVKNNYVSNMKIKLANPFLLVDEFARLYADHLPFTYAIKKVYSLSYSDFMKILTSVLSYPRSVTYLQEEDN